MVLSIMHLERDQSFEGYNGIYVMHLQGFIDRLSEIMSKNASLPCVKGIQLIGESC